MATGDDSDFTIHQVSHMGKIVFVAILLVALSLQVFYAIQWERGFDEAWNLYYSRIQPFTKSFRELKHNAHPPLASILLRIPIAFGNDIFWARLGSIIPSCIFILFNFLIFKKLRLVDPLPYLFSFMLSISHGIVNLSVSVRAYTLMAMFISIAIYYYIDIAKDIMVVKSWKIYIFIACISFAIWTEYSSGFVTISLIVCLLLSVIINEYKIKCIVKRLVGEWPGLILLVTSFIGVVYYFSWTVMPVWQAHVSKHYLQPQETILHFIKRGVSANLSYFTPLSIDNRWGLLFVTLLGILGTIFCVFRLLKSKQHYAKAAILCTHICLWGLLILTGISNIYPFGGSMRHQFILFPFLFISSAIILNECLKWLQNKAVLYGVCTILALGSLYTSINAFSGPPLEEFPPYPLFQKAFQGFTDVIDDNDSVYVTDFNHYAFFYHTLDYQWTFLRECENMCYVSEVQKNEGKIHLITDRTNWLIPIPLDERCLNRFIQILKNENLNRMWIFSVIEGKSFFQTDNLRIIDEFNRKYTNTIQIKDLCPLGDGYAFLIEMKDEGT